MRGVVETEAREQLSRWLSEGPAQLSAALGLIRDYERVALAAEAAEAEVERLRGFVYENEKLRSQLETAEAECGKLRDVILELRAEQERQHREREEIAASLSEFMNGVLARLRAA
jgi:chromosome segregation ATPase